MEETHLRIWRVRKWTHLSSGGGDRRGVRYLGGGGRLGFHRIVARELRRLVVAHVDPIHPPGD